MWVLFEYENGGNPYIAKTEEEKQKMLDKYKEKALRISGARYFITESEENLWKY